MNANPLPNVPEGFGVIYCDPPWPYKNKGTRAAASDNYSTMTMQDLHALPVKAVAAENCALFMWATPPMIVEALELGFSWGFTFKTFAFVWAKKNRKSNTPFFGMGNYTRANTEPCLLFVKGKPKRVDASVPQFLWSSILRHSEKPAEIRYRIEELMGNVPRLEMFSRHNVKGWTRWGNEILPEQKK